MGNYYVDFLNCLEIGDMLVCNEETEDFHKGVRYEIVDIYVGLSHKNYSVENAIYFIFKNKKGNKVALHYPTSFLFKISDSLYKTLRTRVIDYDGCKSFNEFITKRNLKPLTREIVFKERITKAHRLFKQFNGWSVDKFYKFIANLIFDSNMLSYRQIEMITDIIYLFKILPSSHSATSVAKILHGNTKLKEKNKSILDILFSLDFYFTSMLVLIFQYLFHIWGSF